MSTKPTEAGLFHCEASRTEFILRWLCFLITWSRRPAFVPVLHCALQNVNTSGTELRLGNRLSIVV
jgi:hypothetical protein